MKDQYKVSSVTCEETYHYTMEACFMCLVHFVTKNNCINGKLGSLCLSS